MSFFNSSSTAKVSSFDVMAEKMATSFTAPVIKHTDLSDDHVLLDARELVEYKTSHLKEAVHIGYNDLDMEKLLLSLDKSKKYVVYCSVGYRSGDIAQKLLKEGFKTFNLYGGIFNWKNKGNEVYKRHMNKETKTEHVHGFNRKWSRFLQAGKVILDD
jgi:rhodanese-related sulfurtransferase